MSSTTRHWQEPGFADQALQDLSNKLRDLTRAFLYHGHDEHVASVADIWGRVRNLRSKVDQGFRRLSCPTGAAPVASTISSRLQEETEVNEDIHDLEKDVNCRLRATLKHSEMVHLLGAVRIVALDSRIAAESLEASLDVEGVAHCYDVFVGAGLKLESLGNEISADDRGEAGAAINEWQKELRNLAVYKTACLVRPDDTQEFLERLHTAFSSVLPVGKDLWSALGLAYKKAAR